MTQPDTRRKRRGIAHDGREPVAGRARTQAERKPARLMGLSEERPPEELAESAQAPAFQQGESQVEPGTPPTPGRAGFVELAFEQGIAAGRIDAEGHMDFFERGLLKTVSAGQLVALIHPPEPGQAGLSEDGQMLPARAGEPAKLQLGAGVTREPEGRVLARHGGVVLHKPGELLDVVAEHVHRGAVDLHSGHLDMQGSLTVKGDVERLLQARATGDVEVLGSVSGGSLRAGGSVRVSGNVRGGDGACVVAEHDVTIKSCESADVTAGGALRVREAVNSQLQGHEVLVSGRLRGGAATAERRVSVKEAGTPTGR